MNEGGGMDRGGSTDRGGGTDKGSVADERMAFGLMDVLNSYYHIPSMIHLKLEVFQVAVGLQ